MNTIKLMVSKDKPAIIRFRKTYIDYHTKRPSEYEMASPGESLEYIELKNSERIDRCIQKTIPGVTLNEEKSVYNYWSHIDTTYKWTLTVSWDSPLPMVVHLTNNIYEVIAEDVQEKGETLREFNP